MWLNLSMSTYHDYDDDDQNRLPAGFKRVGYDADTEIYTYESAEGEMYRGAPGNRYGRLVPVLAPIDYDFEEHVQDNTSSYRYFLPFLLLVIVFLLMVIAPPWKHNFGFGSSAKCETGTIKHEVRSGETCYELSKKYSTTLEELKKVNPKLKCDNLQIGEGICVPAADVS